jgi:hypothetical protein
MGLNALRRGLGVGGKRESKKEREKQKRMCSYKSKCIKENPAAFKSQTDLHIH